MSEFKSIEDGIQLRRSPEPVEGGSYRYFCTTCEMHSGVLMIAGKLFRAARQWVEKTTAIAQGKDHYERFHAHGA